MFEGRGAVGYAHGYDGEVFYLGMALDLNYIEGFVEGCSERIGEDNKKTRSCCESFGRTKGRRIPCWRY